MRMRIRLCRGQLRALPWLRSDMPVEACRRLEDDKRASFPRRCEERLIQTDGGFVADTGVHFDAIRPQHREPSSPNEWKWILHRRHDTPNAGRDDPLGTRSCLAGVDARLEGAIESGAARVASGFFESVYFSVWLAGALMRSLTEHHAVVRYDACADDRVWRRAPKAATRVLDRPPHPSLVVYHFSWNNAST
jgi:hypothetical protein